MASGDGLGEVVLPALHEELHTKSQLANGLRVYVRSTFTSRVVHIGLFVKHGSLHEDHHSNGIAHFIEHVVFNARYFPPKVAAVYERLIASGAYYEATTTKEYTRFTLFCLPESLNDALRFFSLVARPRLPDADAVDTERSVILHEHAMTFASRSPLDAQVLDSCVWGDQSIGLFILGRKENIQRFTQEEVEQRMRRYYVPERALLAMVGPIEAEPALARVRELFGDWARAEEPVPEPQVIVKPQITVLPTQGNRVTLQLGYLGGLGVTLGSPYRLPLELLADVLGGSPRSRLFLQLRQVHRLAYLVHTALITYELGGYLGIFINCDRGDLKRCYETVRATFHSLREEGIGEAELGRARSERLVAALDTMEINRQYLYLLGRRALLGEPFDRDSETEQIRRVQVADVRPFCDSLLEDDAPAVVGLGLTADELAELYD